MISEDKLSLGAAVLLLVVLIVWSFFQVEKYKPEFIPVGSQIMSSSVSPEVITGKIPNVFWGSTYTYLRGNYSGFVSTQAGDQTYTGEWLQLKMAQPIILTKYTIKVPDSLKDSNAPRNFVILGQNDGPNWFLLDTRTDQKWTSSSETFTIPNPSQSFSTYRLIVQKVGSSTYKGSSNNAVIIKEWTITA